MEFFTRHLCFLILVQVTLGALDNEKVSDPATRRLDYISSTLARPARKQRTIENRLDDINDNTNKFCSVEENQKRAVSDPTFGEIKEEMDNMKNTILSEKEYVRTFKDYIDKKITSQTTSSDLESRMESMEKSLAVLETSFNVLGDKIQSMLKKIGAMETSSEILDGKIKTMNNRIADAATTSDAAEFQIKSIQKNMAEAADDLKTRMDKMKGSIASIKGKQDRKVSFSAQYRPPAGTDATRFKKQRVVPFNHVFYNEGSGYNETTGIFTAPVSGVYQFIFFVDGWHDKDDFTCPAAAVVVLYIDGCSAETMAVAVPSHKNQNIQAGNAYTSYLRKGQKAQVATGSNCEEYIIHGYRTTFNGVLLY